MGLIGVAFDNVESVRRQVNRYAPLTLDADDGRTTDAAEFVRENGEVWLNSTSEIYVANPLLTEATFARSVCGVRALARRYVCLEFRILRLARRDEPPPVGCGPGHSFEISM